MAFGARAKGSKGELEVVKIINTQLEQWGCRPVAERNLLQTRSGGVDICLGQLWVEVKRVQQPSMGAWFKKLHAQLPEGCVGVIWHRKNRQQWSVWLAPKEHIAVAEFFKRFEKQLRHAAVIATANGGQG